jgi:hypothetical protein
MGSKDEQIGRLTKSKRKGSFRGLAKKVHRKAIRRSEKKDLENPKLENKYKGWTD